MEDEGAMRAGVGGEVTLREVRVADLGALFAFESDEAWRGMAMMKARSWGAFEEVWGKIIGDREAGVRERGVAQRVIAADGGVCGVIGCRMVGGRLMVGYGLGRAHWGRGIASRALGLFLAEEEMEVRPLYATAAASNGASIRVLEKSGFVIAERRMAPETERAMAREEVVMVLG